MSNSSELFSQLLYKISNHLIILLDATEKRWRVRKPKTVSMHGQSGHSKNHSRGSIAAEWSHYEPHN